MTFSFCIWDVSFILFHYFLCIKSLTYIGHTNYHPYSLGPSLFGQQGALCYRLYLP